MLKIVKKTIYAYLFFRIGCAVGQKKEVKNLRVKSKVIENQHSYMNLRIDAIRDFFDGISRGDGVNSAIRYEEKMKFIDIISNEVMVTGITRFTCETCGKETEELCYSRENDKQKGSYIKLACQYCCENDEHSHSLRRRK